MIRQFIFISALTITLALTATSWLIPESYQKIEISESHSNEVSLEFHTLKLQQNDQNSIGTFQQFLVLNEEPKKKMPSVIVPIKKPVLKAALNFTPSPPLVVPPNLQYLGQMIDPDGIKKIFLSSDEETYVVKTGDVLSNRWKINAIQNDQITILDLINQQFFILYI